MYEEDESSVSKQSFVTIKAIKRRRQQQQQQQQYQKVNSRRKNSGNRTEKLSKNVEYDSNGNSENSIKEVHSEKDDNDKRSYSESSERIQKKTISISSSELLESESDEEDTESISSVEEKNNESDNGDTRSETYKSSGSGTGKSVEHKSKSDLSQRKSKIAEVTDNRQQQHQQRKQRRNHKQEKNLHRKKKTSRKTDEADLILGIHLIRVENMKFKKYIRSPRIRISLYDIVTGNLVKSSSNPLRKMKNRQTENEDDMVDCIQPLISGEGKIIESNSLSFAWNERISVEEDFSYLNNDNIVIFFEIIDTVKENSGSFGKFKKKDNVNAHKKYQIYEKMFRIIEPFIAISNGWYNICWGYLKLTENRELMTTILNAKFLSLQLYKYKNLKKHKTVLEQWKSKQYLKYRGILDISLSALKSNSIDKQLEKTVSKYSAGPSDKVDGDNDDVKNSNNRKLIENLITLPNTSWDRIRKRFIKDEQEHQQLPERIVFKQTLLKGSSVCSFSPDDGNFLAYAETISQQIAVIHILEIPNFNLLCTLKGHTRTIHSLNWLALSSFVDEKDSQNFLLISTSEDQSSIVWNLSRSSYSIQYVLPHPSFVYSACFIYDHTNSFITIATGGRDYTVRFWKIDATPHNPEENKEFSTLFQESLNHNSYIISVVYNTKLRTLYSAEVNGVVWEWERNQVIEKSKWEPIRKFDQFDSRINQINLIMVKNQLCILTDSVLYSIDLKTKFTKRLLLSTVASSISSQSSIFTGIGRMCFSSRGTYAFITSEMNSGVNSWNLVSEDFLKNLQLPNCNQIICWIETRSDLNYLAISCYGRQRLRHQLETGGIYVYGCMIDGKNPNHVRRSLEENIVNDKDDDGVDGDGGGKESKNECKKMKRKSCDFSLKNENFRTVLTKLDAIFKFSGSHSDRMKDRFVEKEYDYRRDTDDWILTKKKSSSSSSSASSGQQSDLKNANLTFSIDTKRRSDDSNDDDDDDDENVMAGSTSNRTFVMKKKFSDGTYNVLKESNCVINNDTYSISSRESTDQTDISESLDDGECGNFSKSITQQKQN